MLDFELNENRNGLKFLKILFIRVGNSDKSSTRIVKEVNEAPI
jgi:hypothetical protein